MEEIGCHFKFEQIDGNVYHNTKLLLSSGRNCLRYIMREKNIKTLFLPYFLCESLSEVANNEGVKINYYHIDNNFEPIGVDSSALNQNTYLYYVNYYGLFRDKAKRLVDEYKYIIIDNTHDFFDSNIYNADTIYNYRKYFGVPDGACIVSKDLKYNDNYSKGKSLNKAIEMLSRDETGEYFHYPTFLDADKYFKEEDLKYMSNFTENYLHALDYDKILESRIKNYKYLSNALSKYNQLDLSDMELTYMYPLVICDGNDLRQFLQNNNIYSLRLWANINWNGANADEIKTADNFVLLPIDQRYSEKEMEYISDTIDKYYSKVRVLNKGGNK